MSDLYNDGSVEAAAASMPDIEALESAQPVPAPPSAAEDADSRATRDDGRDDSGRFKAKTEAAAAATDADDDDPFVEYPAEEEGKEPTRAKLSEVWQGYQKSKTLETELEKVRGSVRPMLPQEVEAAISQVQNVRQNYVNAMEQWSRVNQPVPPSLDLVNPAHPSYNPELFNHKVQEFQSQKARLEEVTQEIEAQKARATKDQEAVFNARIAREAARIKEVWPEFTKPESAEKARTDLKSLYGFDDATLNSVIDSRFYALAKDALAFRMTKAKEAEAVKVVKTKPKLVSGVARQAATAQQRVSQDAFKRLQQSGSVEDAAAALAGFF